MKFIAYCVILTIIMNVVLSRSCQNLCNDLCACDMCKQSPAQVLPAADEKGNLVCNCNWSQGKNGCLNPENKDDVEERPAYCHIKNDICRKRDNTLSAERCTPKKNKAIKIKEVVKRLYKFNPEDGLPCRNICIQQCVEKLGYDAVHEYKKDKYGQLECYCGTVTKKLEPVTAYCYGASLSLPCKKKIGNYCENAKRKYIK